MNLWFFGSDKYSQIVLNSLKKEPNIKITKIISPAGMRHLIISNFPHPDVGVLASFGAIVPPEILNFPKKGILNIHPSLLPKYRGPSPVQTAILNGEWQTGVTIIKMDEKIDHGPIVAQFTEEILPTDTSESLYFRLFSAGAEVLKTILPAYLEGRIELREQNHSAATYTKKLTRDDGFIPLKKLKEAMEGRKADRVGRQIRAFYPWPGSWTEITIPDRKAKPIRDRQNKRLKILKAHLENGKLILDQVQLDGKKPVSFKQFCEGYPEAELAKLASKNF
ncbi:MAG: methionyl-tRNA formyltransferase [Microgenomates group bacterium]